MCCIHQAPVVQPPPPLVRPPERHGQVVVEPDQGGAGHQVHEDHAEPEEDEEVPEHEE